MTQIEAIVNTRPLFSISSDPTDLTFLSLVQLALLIGSKLNSVPDFVYISGNVGKKSESDYIIGKTENLKIK